MTLTKKEKQAILRACERVEIFNSFSCCALKHFSSQPNSTLIENKLTKKYMDFHNQYDAFWRDDDGLVMFTSDQRIIALLLFYYAHGDVE